MAALSRLMYTNGDPRGVRVRSSPPCARSGRTAQASAWLPLNLQFSRRENFRFDTADVFDPLSDLGKYYVRGSTSCIGSRDMNLLELRDLLNLLLTLSDGIRSTEEADRGGTMTGSFISSQTRLSVCC